LQNNLLFLDKNNRQKKENLENAKSKSYYLDKKNYKQKEDTYSFT
jgi:hypothetical protein